jgi:hypothetical protein
MRLLLKDNLPFTTIVVTHKSLTVEISDVLIDTGSGTSILAADILKTIQITPSPEDILYTIRGVGGKQTISKYEKK